MSFATSQRERECRDERTQEHRRDRGAGVTCSRCGLRKVAGPIWTAVFDHDQLMLLLNLCTYCEDVEDWQAQCSSRSPLVADTSTTEWIS
jgi:hypothetical protein